jgi:hypothetical protein
MVSYKKGFKYQLAEPHTEYVSIFPKYNIYTDYLMLTPKGKLIISHGYAWDGASGPTFDTKSSMAGSLVHDALYQLMRMGLLDRSWRKQADKELKRICIENGMWKWRAWLWYQAVRIGAGPAASAKNMKKVFTA